MSGGWGGIHPFLEEIGDRQLLKKTVLLDKGVSYIRNF